MAADRDLVRNSKVLQNESNKTITFGAQLAEQEVSMSFIVKREIEVDENITEDMHQLETEVSDL